MNDALTQSTATSRPPARKRRAMFFEHKPRWGLTARGWITAVAACAVVAFATIRYAHRFLAVTDPRDAQVLVVEGWMPEYAMRQLLPLIDSGHYDRIVVVGAPVGGAGRFAAIDDTYAYVGVKTLRKLGVPASKLDMVPTPRVERDRTFHCAVDLKLWLESHDLRPTAINVVTMGPHARRSRLLFEKALGDRLSVGVISLNNEEYDSSHWWRYSEGIRETISEASAYLYVRTFFHPSRQ